MNNDYSTKDLSDLRFRYLNNELNLLNTDISYLLKYSVMPDTSVAAFRTCTYV